MFTVDVPGLMMTYAPELMGGLLIGVFLIGISSAIVNLCFYLFHPESIDPRCQCQSNRCNAIDNQHYYFGED